MTWLGFVELSPSALALKRLNIRKKSALRHCLIRPKILFFTGEATSNAMVIRVRFRVRSTPSYRHFYA